MDLHRARALLGITDRATVTEVRAAYRARMRATHPDVAGPGRGHQAAELNEAYAVLTARAEPMAAGASPAERPPATASAGPPTDPPVPAEVLDGDTIHLPVPGDEAFVRLLEACHVIGEVTYVDRSCPILEALVRVPGEGTCSLVITLQGRADGTDAFCTLEAIERVAQPPVAPVTAALVAALARTG